MRVVREQGEAFPMFRTCGFRYGNGCACTLEINENDIKKIIRRYSPDHPWPDYGFVCPKCHTFNHINESFIPKQVQEKSETINPKTLEPCDTPIKIKASKAIRRFDDLGRIVIPREIREPLDIKEGQWAEISTDNDNQIILMKCNSPDKEENEEEVCNDR